MKIEVIEQDISTPEGWRTFVDRRLAEQRERARAELGGLAEVLLVVTRDDTGADLPRPAVVASLGLFHGANDDEVEESKADFVALTRSLSVVYRAIASICVTEGWFSTPETEADLTRRPSQDPNRKEALYITVTHRSFMPQTRAVMAFITRVNGARRVEDWTWMPEEMICSGRMADFSLPLTVEQHPEYPDSVEMCRRYLQQGIADGALMTLKPERGSS